MRCNKPRFAVDGSGAQYRNLPRAVAYACCRGRTGRAISWESVQRPVALLRDMVPEISDRIVEIDRAMRWGYANKLGPFELWDALGFDEYGASRSESGSAAEHRADVAHRAALGKPVCYRPAATYFDFRDKALSRSGGAPRHRGAERCETSHGVISENAGASLIDLGDGVLCVEFHSKMNAIGEDNIADDARGARRNGTRISMPWWWPTRARHFSVGANLMLVLLGAQEEEWDELDAAVRRFQQVNMAMKYAPKPVVAAPFGMTLGGGCEVALHATRVQASAELYMGLVEVGVGLIPAGGGCKELLLRLEDPRTGVRADRLRARSPAAPPRRVTWVLRESDAVSMNPERLDRRCKALALSLAPELCAGMPRAGYQGGGRDGFALLKLGVWTWPAKASYISDYDAVIGEKLAHILSGGRWRGEHGVRTVSAGSGTRSVPESVRQARNASTHPVYAEDRKGS